MRRIRVAAAAGPDWRATFDALRPATDDIWRSLPPASRSAVQSPGWCARPRAGERTPQPDADVFCKQGVDSQIG